ncbi:NAD-dependent epimerase/dehydratase [Stappia aggregata IAM 12614]|uniref:NAD-dependent epimerase/dehydratase n=1 Tax=Roseibium aggregatum (strain ATCC 25650 / DSM 13394 / JCM 20685 / NBRC 16684 / NCIMB 2208 / IAM 12614 / B1) TaxID=384765 RepID=A0NZP3_ROSAI|nr:NAD-dependent epimerase/dehydratase family protein [Roseibium aggregatum]EAV41610.1 NAD-dependent epimerase/dehydratase [Stappia aggregata IAM 12614] [Roseibium aggregatum IAM 12614]
MKVLVIGGCGFIGSHVVDKCLQEGLSVRVMDTRPELYRPPLPGVDYVFQDLSDHHRLAGALAGVDAVVHLASTTVPSTSNLDPAADIAGNLIPTVRLLEAMRASGTRKLVFFSSGGTVYGIPAKDPVPEDHPLNPISSYGIVKAAIEQYLRMEQQLHGLEFAALRPANIYGPRQAQVGLLGVIGTYLRKVSDDEPIEIWGDGSIVRDFVHVEDVADLCHRALVSNASGSFNAGSGVGTSISQIVEIISQTTGHPVQPVYKPGRNFDVPRVVLDIAKAQATFDWLPTVPLHRGIRETWDWVRSQSAS